MFLRQNTNNKNWEWAYRIDQNQMELNLPEDINSLNGKRRRLTDIINYKEFFDTFVDAKRTRVEFFNDPNIDEVALIKGNGKLIRINTAKYEGKEKTKEQIAHELQHYIQSWGERGEAKRTSRLRQEAKSRLNTDRRITKKTLSTSTGPVTLSLEKELENINEAIAYLNKRNPTPVTFIEQITQRQIDVEYLSDPTEREARLAETDYSISPYKDQ